MRAKVIPDNCQPAVLERAGRGETCEQIAGWLTKKLGRTVARQRVAELLERVRKERAPIAQAVIAEKVGKTVGTDLDAMEEMIGVADKVMKRMDTAGDLRGVIAALRERHSLVKTRLELSGGHGGAPITVVDPYAEPKKKK